jgi:hypothetical protein
MKSKVVKKDAPVAGAKPVVTDPFETLAESTPTVSSPAAKPVKAPRTAAPKTLKKAKTVSADAFETPAAEYTSGAAVPQTPASPVKKTTAAGKAHKAKGGVTAGKRTAKTGSRIAAKAAAKPASAKRVKPLKTAVELSPVAKTLAEPVLPELEPENRARLLMQSPTKIYFYWSVKENPYRMLRDAFGDDGGSYVLVSKLVDVRRGTESIQMAEPAGEYWFDVEPDGEYQAEIGFYAPNRPYFRIIYSNTVETPRRSPSPRAAVESAWTVSANQFAEVLDVSGFAQDAFDVAMAGDDHDAAQDATYAAFASFTGTGLDQLESLSPNDIRHALYALASGQRLGELRWQISPRLFAVLQANAGDLDADRAMNVLNEYFDIDESEVTSEQFGPGVYGASRVNFPRTLKTRTTRRYSPVSSRAFRV